MPAVYPPDAGSLAAPPAPALVDRIDDRQEPLGVGGLDALVLVGLLGGEPRVIALHREAQDPVLAELCLELVHLRLEVGRPVPSRGALVLPLGRLRRLTPRDLLCDGTRTQRDRAAAQAGLDLLLQVLGQLRLVLGELALVSVLLRHPLPVPGSRARNSARRRVALARDVQLLRREAPVVPEPRALRRALPVRRVAGVAQRTRQEPPDRPALARLGVAGAVDPEVGVHLRVRGVRGGRRPHAAEA